MTKKSKEVQAEESAEKEAAIVQNWLSELEKAYKREKDFLKRGEELISIYEGKKKETTPFNVLYSNTMTILPALYSNTPVPVVERRFKDDDPLGKISCDVAKRVLEFELDTGFRDYAPFDKCLKQATLEGLVAGRGMVAFVYDTTSESPKVEETAAALGSKGSDATATPLPPSGPSYETVCPKHIPWNRARFGFSLTWEDTPWIAFLHYMDREELVTNFGKEIGNAVELTISGAKEPADDSESAAGRPPKDSEGATLAEVWQIWDKNTRTVVFVSPGLKAKRLKQVADPLKLSGFFPTPCPLTFIDKISSMVPVALYDLYENQATELNRITVRINGLIKMCKIAGFYDSTIEGIEEALQKDDGLLTPAENISALNQGNHLDNSIWLLPLEKINTVIQQLYVAREQCKRVIYEIMGLADIQRGMTAASETASAQQLKSEWGTLRLQTPKDSVERYVRDCLRIMAEISFTHFSPQTVSQMTGLKFPSREEKQQAQQLLAQAQQMAAQAQAQAQVTGQPPPPAPQPPPEAVQAASLPAWEDILELLSDDIQRNYRIDVETNSTVNARATEDKRDVGELLTAISQFFNSIAPLVESGTMPFDAAKSILLAVIRRYKFGSEVEDQIKALKAPGPPPGQEQGAQAQQQAEQAKAAAEAQKAQNEMALEAKRMQLAELKHQQEMENARQEQALKQKEFEANMRKIELDIEMMEAKAAAQKAKAAAQASQPRQVAGGT